MSRKTQRIKVEKSDALILWIRGQKVILDSDAAKIYSVTTAALNQALRKNVERFPDDLAFELTEEEFAFLKSKMAVSKKSPRRLPWVFTGRGALMLANVLNSPVAVQASICLVRAFVQMREMLTADKQLGENFSKAEQSLDGQDQAIANLFEVIRHLLAPLDEPKREIGFHIREQSVPYRIKRKI